MKKTQKEWPRIPRWMVIVAGIGTAGYALYLLRGVLTPVFTAFLIAYLLDPVVTWLEGRRIPRWIAVLLLLGAFLLALVILSLIVIPTAVREALEFLRALPGNLETTWKVLEPWLAEQGVVVPHTIKELNAQLGANAGAISHRVASNAGSVLGWVAGGTASVLEAVVTLILIPVLAFYFLLDFPHIKFGVAELVPHPYRPLVFDIARDIDAVVAQFIRGQVLVMTLLAIAYSVGYSAVGVPLALPIGLLAGLVSFIPYVGGTVALGAALAACAISGPTWLQLGLVIVVHFSIQTVEGMVITPRIMADQVGLPAVWIVLAMLGFGEVFGVVGVVIAVPVAAVARTLLVRALAAYRTSSLYGAPSVRLGPPSLASEVSPSDVVADVVADVLADVVPEPPTTTRSPPTEDRIAPLQHAEAPAEEFPPPPSASPPPAPDLEKKKPDAGPEQ